MICFHRRRRTVRLTTIPAQAKPSGLTGSYLVGLVCQEPAYMTYCRKCGKPLRFETENANADIISSDVGPESAGSSLPPIYSDPRYPA